jgi:cyclopropane fatty-acyl-phospholipid synthase-like methyltransferase
MNIYISKDDKKIENFQTVKIQNFQEEMSRVVTNSCENIVADEIVDFLSSNSLSNFIQALSSKLRLNGKLFITGIEIGVLCRHTISEDISSNDFSAVIAPRASLSSVNDIVKLLKENGLDIESSTIKGLKYEISATRR